MRSTNKRVVTISRSVPDGLEQTRYLLPINQAKQLGKELEDASKYTVYPLDDAQARRISAKHASIPKNLPWTAKKTSEVQINLETRKHSEAPEERPAASQPYAELWLPLPTSDSPSPQGRPAEIRMPEGSIQLSMKDAEGLVEQESLHPCEGSYPVEESVATMLMDKLKTQRLGPTKIRSAERSVEDKSLTLEQLAAAASAAIDAIQLQQDLQRHLHLLRSDPISRSLAVSQFQRRLPPTYPHEVALPVVSILQLTDTGDTAALNLASVRAARDQLESILSSPDSKANRDLMERCFDEGLGPEAIVKMLASQAGREELLGHCYGALHSAGYTVDMHSGDFASIRVLDHCISAITAPDASFLDPAGTIASLIALPATISNRIERTRRQGVDARKATCRALGEEFAERAIALGITLVGGTLVAVPVLGPIVAGAFGLFARCLAKKLTRPLDLVTDERTAEAQRLRDEDASMRQMLSMVMGKAFDSSDSHWLARKPVDKLSHQEGQSSSALSLANRRSVSGSSQGMSAPLPEEQGKAPWVKYQVGNQTVFRRSVMPTNTQTDEQEEIVG